MLVLHHLEVKTKNSSNTSIVVSDKLSLPVWCMIYGEIF
jgi:hypothetical protein